MSFVRKRFNALFACQAFGGLNVLVGYASIVDSIIVGNLVGVEALAGVAAVFNRSVFPFRSGLGRSVDPS